MKREFVRVEAVAPESVEERKQDMDITPADVSEKYVLNDIWFA